MAAYITKTAVDAAVSAAVRSDLFSDDTADAFLDDLIAKASARVQVAAWRAGYTSLGATTTDEIVKLATLGQFLALAYNRKQQKLPEAYYDAFNLMTGIRTGEVPIPSMTPALSAGVGGSKFSETDSSVTGARYNPLSRLKLEGY